MKLSIASLALAIGACSANIIFTHVPLSCNPNVVGHSEGYTGCLRGQVCLQDGTCAAAQDGDLYPLSFRRSLAPSPVEKMEKRAYSTNGQCGPKNGNLLCSASSTAYFGTCCSASGWCGNTAAYCGTGCTSGCSVLPNPSASATAPRSDGRCGPGFGGATCAAGGPFGGCCSQFGYCGSTATYCLPSNGCISGCTGTSPPQPSVTAGAPRSDGRCGPSYGNAVCDPNGSFGGCCSQYGYCGKTSSYCLPSNGCISGCSGGTTTTKTPTGEPVVPTPTSTGTGSGPPTKNGACGVNNGDTICGNWPNGACCSMYGFCGSDSAHCGAGCQSGPCDGAPVVPAPGPSPAPKNVNPGFLQVVGQSGVPPMHAALLTNGRVVFLDKIENYTQIKLSDGYYAYSSEYDPVSNTAVGLSYKTNAFCSGGVFLPDGALLSVGGNAPLTWLDPTVGNGFQAIRYLHRSPTDPGLNGQSWSEPGNQLASARWYASAQILPSGSIFVASGSLNGLDPTVDSNNNPTYEILNNVGVSSGQSVTLPILVNNQPYYMYPFIHLLSDGTLFIFVAKASEVFDLQTNTAVATMPTLPGDYRTYPNTGGSVLMPLSSYNNWLPDIIICGGGAYQDITSPTDPSCGRIAPLAVNPQWEMDSMPEGRGMVEGTLLPDGTIIWVNGCNLGAQGFGLAADPTYEVLIYEPTAALGSRWSVGPSSTIARLYHSVAVLLMDGSLMIAGSNPVQMPVLTPVPNQVPSELYVTEFRVENYQPPYISGANQNKRPTNMVLSTTNMYPGGQFSVSFNAPGGNSEVQVTIYHGGFSTHSLHMDHRMAFCDFTGYVAGATSQHLTVTLPPTNAVIPPGPYLIFVVVNGVPSISQFVSVGVGGGAISRVVDRSVGQVVSDTFTH